MATPVSQTFSWFPYTTGIKYRGSHKTNSTKEVTLTVDYSGLHLDSFLIDAITDSDLEAGDIVIYDMLASNGEEVTITHTGLESIANTSTTVTFQWHILDMSDSYNSSFTRTQTVTAP